MIKIEFNGNIIEIPSNPDEISLEKGLNIHYIWSNQEHNFETEKEVLFILTNLDLCYKLSGFSIIDIIKRLNLLDFKEIEIIYYPTFKLKGICYGLHKLKQLNVKEYMDLEHYLNQGEDPLEHLDKICSILYRPIKIKNNSIKNILYNIRNSLKYRYIKPLLYKNYEIEDYDEKHLKNSDLFKEKFSYTMGISAFINYNLYKEGLKKEFPPLFKQESKEEDPYAEREAAYIKEHKIGKSFEERWGFYHILMELVPDLSERILWEKRDIKELLKLLVYQNIKTNIQNQINK